VEHEPKRLTLSAAQGARLREVIAATAPELLHLADRVGWNASFLTQTPRPSLVSCQTRCWRTTPMRAGSTSEVSPSTTLSGSFSRCRKASYR
jgi:hypothetical protein